MTDIKDDDFAIAVCNNCGTPVLCQGDWGFHEDECEPTCLKCGTF